MLEEFTRFLPESLAAHSAAQLIRSQAQRYRDRGSGPPLVRPMLIEKVLCCYFCFPVYHCCHVSRFSSDTFFIIRIADEKGLLLLGVTVIIVLTVLTLMMIKQWLRCTESRRNESIRRTEKEKEKRARFTHMRTRERAPQTQNTLAPPPTPAHRPEYFPVVHHVLPRLQMRPQHPVEQEARV